MKKIIFFSLLTFFLVSFSLAQTYTSSSIKTTDVYYGFKVDPDKYFLGVGDRVVIYIIKEKDMPEVYEVVISPTGMINLPVIGNIRISGLSLSEASKEVSRYVLRFYPRSNVIVDLVFPRYIKISITGEVINPGIYNIIATSTLDDLIKLAGGLKKSASIRSIQIRRGGKILEFDYLKYLRFGDESQNPFLLEGDLVFIPLIKKSVRVLGEVREPGIYEIKEGERLKSVIEMAGGLSVYADYFGGYIERQKGDKKEIIDINLFKLFYEKDEKENLVLNDGDYIYIPKKVDRIYVLGYVKDPKSFVIVGEEIGGSSEVRQEGESAFKGFMKVSELINRAGGVLPNGSKRRIQIIRDGQVIKEVDLFKVLVKGDTQEEAVKLVPGDVIYVPLAEKTVRILGEVRDPGIYEVIPGEKIRDLIEMAGGFTVRADLRNITVERYITERRQIINLDLTKLYKGGDESVNILLEDGDIINIPIRSE